MNDNQQDLPMNPPTPLLSSVVAGARAAPVARPRSAVRHDPVTAGLQRMFETIAAEPIPDDFMRLLDSIEASAAQVPDVRHPNGTEVVAGHHDVTGNGNTNGGAK